MSEYSLPLSQLIHENLSIIMCFAYSRRPLENMVDTKFAGRWRYLNKALLDISQERAEKACLELALFLRMIDDEEGISEYHKETHVPNCGRLIVKGGKEKSLTFREVSNKMIHSAKLEWNFEDQSLPKLVCHSRNKEKWIRAEIDMIALASVCGQLMS